MPDIVLTTLNAKYAHSAFGLRYLLANLGSLRDRATIAEFEISQRPIDILEVLLSLNPRIIGLGVYIWNIEPATRLIGDLKRIRPDITVILGGPEVSYETAGQPIVDLADYVITGEADFTFTDVCQQLMAGERPLNKIIPASLPRFEQLALPYHLYTDEDIAHRVIYVEASRGCPFTCEFCLSALYIPVRQAGLDAFLQEMDTLIKRGVRQFKFVDRTFNLNLHVGRAILEFFLDRQSPELFLHFEMIPDRLPDQLRTMIARFPPGMLQFEVGIQTFNEVVCDIISRRQDNEKAESNLNWLREHTGVHVHADLIVGLPGEDVTSFAAGFDRLVALHPQEIQVGMLKRLRGTPIIRHDVEWQMQYSPYSPYEILSTKLVDFSSMQRLRRFSRYWDLVANSGNFIESTPLIWGSSSPFWSFLEWSDWLFEQTQRTNGIALSQLSELLFRFLTEVHGKDPAEMAQPLWRDYQRGGRNDRPSYLRDYIHEPLPPRNVTSKSLPKRQARHSGTLD
ncbi:MAG: Radical domain protein [Planctomycetaceae bacterium]|nr:Radical domain protein [Planctomycetaceae bacterium]